MKKAITSLLGIVLFLGFLTLQAVNWHWLEAVKYITSPSEHIELQKTETSANTSIFLPPSCSDLSIDMGGSQMLPCEPVSFGVSYHNNGNEAANDVVIKLALDDIYEDISIVGVPDADITGHEVSIDVGTLQAEDSRHFVVKATLSCNAQYNRTYCNEASIESDCTPEITPAQAAIELIMECTEDGIIFTLNNVSSTTWEDVSAIIVQDDVILLEIEDDTFNVVSNIIVQDDVILLGGTFDSIPAFGNLSFFVPLDSTAYVHIDLNGDVHRVTFPNWLDGCDENLAGTGFPLQYFQNDPSPIQTIDCKEIDLDVASFFPLESKMKARPMGFAPPHYIPANIGIQYKIEFILDTFTNELLINDFLPPFLDDATVEPGASSHPYTFSQAGNSLSFTMTDVPADPTGGFVQFYVEQIPNNPPGTVIINQANLKANGESFADLSYFHTIVAEVPRIYPTDNFVLTSITPEQLNVCGEPDTITVTVINQNNLHAADLEVQVTFPNDRRGITATELIEQTGVITNNPPYPNSAPVFLINELLAGDTFSFQFLIEANCEIITFAEDNPVDIQFDLTWNNDFANLVTHISTDNALNAPINMLVPNLLVDDFDNQNYEGFVGDTFTRTIHIINSAPNSYVDNFVVLHQESADLQVDSISVGSLVHPFSLGIEGYNNYLAYHIDSTVIATIGDGDIYFEEGEVLEITETITITGCEDLTSIYHLVWNCFPENSDFCDDYTFGADISIANGTPIIDLEVVVGPENYPTCSGPDNPVHVTYNFINKGEEEVEGAGTAYFKNIQLGAGLVSNSIIPYAITANNWGNFTINGAPAPVRDVVFGNQAFIPNGYFFYYDCDSLTYDIDATGDLIDQNADGCYFDVPVQDTLILEFDVWRVCDSLYGAGAFSEPPNYNPNELICTNPINLQTGGAVYTYDSQCGEAFSGQQGKVNSSQRLKYGTELTEFPSDVYLNEAFDVEYKVGELFRRLEMCAEDSLFIEFELPAGFSLIESETYRIETFNGGRTSEPTNDDTQLPLLGVEINNRTVRLLVNANRPSVLSDFESVWQNCVNIRLIHDEPLVNCGSFPVTLNLFSYATCDSCSSCVARWNEDCHEITFQTHNPGICDEPFSTVGFTLERINYDPYQNYDYETNPIPTDPDMYNRKAGIPGDTVRAFFPANFGGSTAIEFDSVMVEVCYEHALRSRWLEFMEGTLHLSNDDNPVIAFNNITAQPVETAEDSDLGGFNRCYRFNVTEAMPDNYAVQSGDSLAIALDFLILPQECISQLLIGGTGGRDLVNNWIGHAYLMKNGNTFSTDIYGNIFEFSQSVLGGNAQSTRKPESCEGIFWAYGCNQNWVCSNGDPAIFPYEFRQEATQDSIVVYVPKDWILTNDLFTLGTIASTIPLDGTLNSPGAVTYQNITPDTITNHEFMETHPMKLVFRNGKDGIIWQEFEVVTENRWKQAIPMTFEPTCACMQTIGANTSTLNNMENTPIAYTYIREFPDQPIEISGEFRTSIPIDYTPPLFELNTTETLQNATTAEACWDIELNNTNNLHSDLNWIAFENTSGQINLSSLVETTNNNVDSIDVLSYGETGETHYWAKLGALEATATRSFKVCANYQNCDIDSIRVFQSYTCSDYPVSPQTTPCRNGETVLKINPLPSELQIEVRQSPPMPTELCAELPYEISISNINFGNANNLSLSALLPNFSSLDYVEGSSSMAFLDPTVFTPIADPAEDDNTLSWSLADEMDSPLWGLSHGDSSQVYIRFNLKTACPFTSGDIISFFANALNNCGSVEEAVTNSPEPIAIDGLQSSGTTLTPTLLSSEPVTPCAAPALLRFQLENTGQHMTIGNEQLVITFPDSIDWEAEDLTINTGENWLQNANPILGTDNNGHPQLTWLLTEGFAPDSLVIWDFYLQTTSMITDCSEFEIDIQIKEVSDVLCIDGGSCGVENILLSTSRIIPIELGNILMTSAIVETNVANEDSVWVQYDIELNNQGGDVTEGIFIHFNQENAPDVLYTEALSGDILNGQTSTYSGLFKAHRMDVCPLSITLSDCMCNNPIEEFVFPTFRDTSLVEICAGDDYDFNGETLTTAGLFCQTFSNPNTCDSVICVELQLLDTFNISEAIEICAGEIYDFNGQVLIENGEYCQDFVAINGCDSTHCIALTVLDTFYITEQMEICAGETIEFNGETLTESGEYCQSFMASNGCDSTHCITLTVLDTFYTTEQIEICAGDTYDFNDELLTESGEYCQSFMASNSCDSTHCITLMVLDTFYTTEQVEICAGEVYDFNGEMLTESGEYCENFIASNNCDSTHCLTLIVAEPIFTEEIIEICEGDSLTIDGMIFSLPGTYFFENESIAQNGCDSTHYLELTIHPQSVVEIIVARSTIFLGESVPIQVIGSETYQYIWTPSEGLSCDDCPNPIASPTEDVVYTLTVIDDNNCPLVYEIPVDVQICEDARITAPNMITPNDDGINDGFWLYEHEGIDDLEFIRIFNRWGELVYETNNIAEKWEGKHRGRPVNPGVYAYHIKGRCIGGEEFNIKGNVTVVK